MLASLVPSRGDLFGGISVGIVALPLCLAFGAIPESDDGFSSWLARSRCAVGPCLGPCVCHIVSSIAVAMH